ncbi:MAG TPA: hypothetical protein VF556_05770 [Pyrinomonadaceae bacterium]|jgi:hypothetical protein
MVENKLLLKIGWFSLIAPSFLVILPDFIDSRSKLNVISLPIPEFILAGLVIGATIAPLILSIWLVGRWFILKGHKRAEFLVLGICNLLTLPWLFVVWLVIGVMSYGMRFNP